MRILPLLLIVSILSSMFITPINTAAYNVDGNDIIPIDVFDQGDDDTLEQWFAWLPMDTYNKTTYHDAFNADFARTFHELIIPFDIGVLSGSETERITSEYNLPAGLCKVFYLSEIQQTFNAVYGTNIDMASLDGLALDGGTPLVRVINDYFVVILSPHGTTSNPNPKSGTVLNENSDYWIWYYQDDWNEPDPIYTIITYKNVAGYDIRAIDYIGFEPPSDEIIRQYSSAADIYKKDELTDFLNDQFKTMSVKMQADPYSSIEDDHNYLSAMQSVNSYAFIDIDDDGNEELIISSTPLSDDTFIPRCISVWDCDNDGNVVCVLAKCGNEARSAYRYFIVNYDNNILLLESTGLNNSAMHISIRNLYKYNGEKLCFEAYDKIYYQSNNDLSFNSDEIFTINGEKYSKEYVGSYIDKIDSESIYLFKQFDDVSDEASQSPTPVITVTINGSNVNFDQPPIIINDRTLVPIRAIFEALGATVEWNGTTQTVTSTHNGTTVKLTIGDNKIYVNGNTKEIDTPAQLINDTTYVPVRVVAESFDAEVNWDDRTKTVSITYKTQQKTPKPTIKPENVITGIDEYDSYINEYDRSKPLKTIIYDFNGDGIDEVIAFYGEIRDKQENRMFGDMILYTFDSEYKTQTIISERSFFIDEINIISDNDEICNLYLTMGSEHIKTCFLYEFSDGTLIKSQCLGGEAELTFDYEIPWSFTDNPFLIPSYNEAKWRAVEFDLHDSDKYIKLDGNDVFENTVKPSYYTNHYGDLYRYSGIEVAPEFIKTFKNGAKYYKTLYEDMIKAGKKVQVIYRSNGCLHINLREYDPVTGYILNSYYTLISHGSKNLFLYDQGYGTYKAVGSDWWNPELVLKANSIAYEYQVDTSADFNNFSDFKVVDSIADQLSSGMLTENLLETIEIVRANQLLKNSWYDYMKSFTGVHKVFGQNLNTTLPKIYDSLGNYRSQLLKSVGAPTNYKTGIVKNRAV